MISIIIPTLNEETTIQPTLENIELHARKVQHEIIVVDGGSLDGTVNNAENFAIVIKSDKGKSVQLNKGAKKAKVHRSVCNTSGMALEYLTCHRTCNNKSRPMLIPQHH